MQKKIKIGFIGAGNMANAMITGMLKNNFTAVDITVSDINHQLLSSLKDKFNINTTTNNCIVVNNCNVIILSVKPQNIKELCRQICHEIKQDKIIISIAAGITTKQLGQYLNTNNIVRAMPNCAAIIGESVTGIFAENLINKKIIDDIFISIGISIWLDDEKLIDSITAISGSGPAYFFLIFEIIISNAIILGISAKDAKKICLQTALGAAKMAVNNNIHTLKQQVTSRGGTTEAALQCFADNNIDTIIQKAILAAKDRAVELSNDN